MTKRMYVSTHLRIFRLFHCFLQVAKQIFFVRASEVSPGEYLVGSEGFLGGGVNVHVMFFESFGPKIKVKTFGPEVELRSWSPGGFYYLGGAPVGPGQGWFEYTLPDDVEFELEEPGL